VFHESSRPSSSTVPAIRTRCPQNHVNPHRTACFFSDIAPEDRQRNFIDHRGNFAKFGVGDSGQAAAKRRIAKLDILARVPAEGILRVSSPEMEFCFRPPSRRSAGGISPCAGKHVQGRSRRFNGADLIPRLDADPPCACAENGGCRQNGSRFRDLNEQQAVKGKSANAKPRTGTRCLQEAA